MLRLVSILCILLAAVPALCQSAPKYQLGNITEVRPHQNAELGASDATGYDVSVKVGDTIYTVLYTPALEEETVKYIAGRDLVVLVGETTIRYTDILGQSHELRIESQSLLAIRAAQKQSSMRHIKKLNLLVNCLPVSMCRETAVASEVGDRSYSRPEP